MTRFEESFKKYKSMVFLVFSCAECGTEVLVPHNSKIPLILDCSCKKPMYLADQFEIEGEIKENL